MSSGDIVGFCRRPRNQSLKYCLYVYVTFQLLMSSDLEEDDEEVILEKKEVKRKEKHKNKWRNIIFKVSKQVYCL